MDNCIACKYFEEDHDYDLGGICTLSRSGNSKLMVSRDEISENNPYLEVSPQFGCTEHEIKIVS